MHYALTLLDTWRTSVTHIVLVLDLTLHALFSDWPL